MSSGSGERITVAKEEFACWVGGKREGGAMGGRAGFWERNSEEVDL